MVLTASFEEAYESRSINISRQSFSQDFTFYICGNFWDTAQTDPTYGQDEDIEALKYAYSILPPARYMPVYAGGGNIYLTLANVTMERMAIDVWRVNATYDVPTKDDGGGNAGPQGDDPQWSTDFVQLEFNVTSQTRHINMSWGTEACQRVVGSSAGVPYPAGEPAPIGMTSEGIEGGETYQREFDFGIQAYFFPQKLTFAYVRRLYRMATTVNAFTFFGFPAASVLFLEASAAGNQYERVPVNFHFKMRPNFKLSQAGPTQLMDPDEDDPEKMFDTYWDPYFPNADNGPAPGGAFSGWSYGDYRMIAKEKQNSKLLVQEPILRTIHTVVGSSNFARFEL